MQKPRIHPRVTLTRWYFLAAKLWATMELPAVCMAWAAMVARRVILLPTAVAAAATRPRRLMQALMKSMEPEMATLWMEMGSPSRMMGFSSRRSRRKLFSLKSKPKASRFR